MDISVAELMERSGVAFGTSGARGLVESMTDEVCYLYTRAFLQHLQQRQLVSKGEQLAVAGDYRPSTPRIMAACLEAARDQGFAGVFCGFIPSPALALFGLRRQLPGIMVTGSHIPDDRNGIKFYKPQGEILKDDEAAIREQSVTLPGVLFGRDGQFRTAKALPGEDSSARALYIQRYLDFFESGCLRGMRVGVYQHSSVSREILCTVLEALGAEVVRLGWSDRFVPVDTEAIRHQDTEAAKQWSREHRLDSIVSTDGDGDRPLVSDEAGDWLRGDIAGLLCAEYLRARVVVTPVSSNTAVERSKLFSEVRRTRIGSPYVIAEMQRARAAGSQRVMGYEANGGFLQEDGVDLYGRVLSALPTRDAMIVIAAILVMSRQRHLPVSALVKALPRRYTYSDRLGGFPTEISRRQLATITDGSVQQARDRVKEIFGDQFGDVSAVDKTDGVRITFSGGDIVHLRPSGNAPELRCYTEADSPRRAQETNRICLDILEAWRI